MRLVVSERLEPHSLQINVSLKVNDYGICPAIFVKKTNPANVSLNIFILSAKIEAMVFSDTRVTKI